MIEVLKGQIQECQARDEIGLEWKSPDSQYSPFILFYFILQQHVIFQFSVVVLQMTAIKQN